MKRRQFLKTSVAAGSGLYFGFLPGCHGNEQTKTRKLMELSRRLVEARSDAIRDKKDKLVGDEVGKLLSRAIENFFGETNAQKCWRQLFTPDDVVGIKINCLAGRGMSTHRELVDAIVEGVKSAGVPEKNIIIWDRANRDLEKAGYRIQTNRNRLKIYGNDQVGYSRRLYEFGEAGSFLSNILVEQCTAVINVPILKDHGIVGMTNALKNFFGAIHNPNKYHDFFGDPYIADVNMFSEIRKKTRLTITDALTAQFEGGPPFMPQWAWNFNGIIVGMDRVAMDAYAWKLIDEKRKEKGLPTLKEAGREPIYIRTAADENHRLGTEDLSKIELIQV